VALYWWNPLARLAAREAAVIGEQACDQRVLDLGTPASAYARHLMEIAETLGRTPRRPAPALPMVERSQLQRRLQMILETTQRGHRDIAALERQIADLLAGDRIAEIERRMQPVRDRLEAAIERLGS